MINRIRLKLIEAARNKSSVTYAALNEELQLGLDLCNPMNRETIENVLREITVYEFYKKRPLIGCLITLHCDQRDENDCFNKVCEELFKSNWHLLKRIKKWEELLKMDCYEFWQNPNNYNQFQNDIIVLN